MKFKTVEELNKADFIFIVSEGFINVYKPISNIKASVSGNLIHEVISLSFSSGEEVITYYCPADINVGGAHNVHYGYNTLEEALEYLSYYWGKEISVRDRALIEGFINKHTFNIATDLKDGDILLRIGGTLCGFTDGQEYIFHEYLNSKSIAIKNVGSGDIARFRFLRRPEVKESPVKQIKELVIDMNYLNEHELLVEIPTQTNFQGNFGQGNSAVFSHEGFELRSSRRLEYGENYLYVRGSVSLCKSLVVRFEDPSKLAQWKEKVTKAVNAYNNFFQEKIYKEEFIKAMKETISEYALGTHEYDTSKCALCKVVAKSRGEEKLLCPINITNCAICPWVVITGNVCYRINKEDELNRIDELVAWIKLYQQM